MEQNYKYLSFEKLGPNHLNVFRLSKVCIAKVDFGLN